MNILFLMGVYPSYGGVEKVSTILANEFVKRGHSVSIVSFEQPHPELATQELDETIRLYRLQYPVSKSENVVRLKEIIHDCKIDILINQWAVPYYVARLCKKATHGTKCKLITVHHNLPNTNARIKDVEIAIGQRRGNLLLNKIKLFIVKTISRLSLRYTYEKSDKFVVLSPSFIDVSARYIWRKTMPKATYIFNPITIPTQREQINKEKEIIWVGRIEDNQKRTRRLVEIWNELETEFPNWRMTIVGDGPNRHELQQHIDDAGLKNIHIEGFQDPMPYYDRASLLVLTSEYEGFPLVVVEAMSRGVVPVVLGSYDAIYDMVTSGDGAFIAAYPYDCKSFSEILRRLMSGGDLSHQSKRAREVARTFDRATIVSKWEKLFEELTKA